MVQTSINRNTYAELVARAQQEIDEGPLPFRRGVRLASKAGNCVS